MIIPLLILFVVLACGNFSAKGGQCNVTFDCTDLFGDAIGSTHDEAYQNAVSYLNTAMQQNNRCGGEFHVTKEESDGKVWHEIVEQWHTVKCAATSQGGQKFQTNIDVYIGMYFRGNYGMVAYKAGTVGPILGEVTKLRYDSEISSRYQQLAKDHTSGGYAAVDCETEKLCPSAETGNWSKPAGFYDGAEQDMLKGLSQFHPEGMTSLNLQRTKFLLFRHNDSAQNDIQVAGGKMNVEFTDGTLIGMDELLAKLNLDPNILKMYQR